MVRWHLVFREGLGDVLSDDYDLIREDLPIEGKNVEKNAFFLLNFNALQVGFVC